MIVYHLTPSRNAASVRWEGLKINRAIGLPRLWFYTPCQRTWALSHISKHQHVNSTDLVEFAYWIPRSWLKRYRRGIWVCYRNVGPFMSLDRRSINDLL